MFAADKFRGWMQRPALEKKDSAAPDYTPMANASKESAEIMAKLGQDQLDFAKKQYEDSLPIFNDIAQSQIALQDETTRQGQDYYDYMVANQRPVEQALNAEAMASGSEAAQETKAAQAVADVGTQYGRQLDQAVRAGLRYGLSGDTLAKNLAQSGTAVASAAASAAGTAREQEKSTGYAKKLDVAGLYRGLPGASQGAYGMALNAGNAAGANTMAPGAQYMQGMGQGASTIGAGRNMLQSGLGSILSSQTSIAGQEAQQGSGLASGLGSIVGAGITVF